jgi:anthranilate phosphoribosyltransferase
VPDPVLTRAIDAVASGHDLSVDEAAEVLAVIMSGDASEAQIAGLLIALRTKGETVEELAGLAKTMRAFAAGVTSVREKLVDTAGTGGGRPTFNVSTTAALIAAGAGCAVAKHGNRSATGRCGSADVLEALGVRIDLTPAQVGACIDEVGFGFMFAPMHHQATRFVVGVRKELAVRTIFNFLGPLTNPAGARRQLIGVSDPSFVETIAGALALLGVERALVVSSHDALDEMSISAPTTVVEVDGANLTTYTVSPEDVGLRTAKDPDAAHGGSPAQNAATTLAILNGEPGPRRDLAVLNAGAAIYVAGRTDDLAAGVVAARAAIDDGAATRTLEALVAHTQELGAQAQPQDVAS